MFTVRPKWIIPTVWASSHHVCPKQSLFLQSHYLCYSYPYLTNGSHTDTQSSYTSIGFGWKNTHRTHISRALIGTGLDLLTAVHLWWKMQHLKEREGGPDFADEMKALRYSNLSKPAEVQLRVRLPGSFFFSVFPLKLHRKEKYM